MTTVIKSICIPFVELNYDADYIMDTFYCQSIATVSKVSFVSFHNKYGKYNRVYLDIHEWHPTEVAYNFIKRLKNANCETRIIHDEDDWWQVEINTESFQDIEEMSNSTTINYLIEESKELEFLELSYQEDDWLSIENDLYILKSFQNIEANLSICV